MMIEYYAVERLQKGPWQVVEYRTNGFLVVFQSNDEAAAWRYYILLATAES